MYICDKCQGSINENSKFCPHCGDPVDENDKVINGLQNKEAYAEVSFGYSSSASYDKAISICKNIPSFMTQGEGKNSIHRLIIPLNEIELIINIYDIVGSWKSSKMLLNGKVATKKDLVYKGLGCYREWASANDKKLYCFGKAEYEFNIWGCKRLNMPIFGWGINWLEQGKFDNDGVWHFDKKSIQMLLNEAIDEVKLCPMIDINKIHAALEMLPNAVDPKVDKNWLYRETSQEINGEYKRIAVGVYPVAQKLYYIFPDNDRPEWEYSDATDNETITENNVKNKTFKEKKLVDLFTNKIFFWLLAILFAIYIFKG